MRPALLLIDLQNDYLARPGLTPAAAQVVAKSAAMLGAFRARGLPVVHVHTLIGADGSDRMPHWQRQGIQQCVAGTAGALPPVELAPVPAEAIVAKRFFSGFASGSLDPLLRASGVDTLVVAGLYTHGCIRATVTDAYQLGYDVAVLADAIASTNAQHALVSREWLDGRAAAITTTDAMLAAIDGVSPAAAAAGAGSLPAAQIAGCWIEAPELPGWDHVDPCDAKRRLARVPLADAALVDRAVRGAAAAAPHWAAMSAAHRAQALGTWADAIERHADAWAGMSATQIGKPVADAREEMARAAAHVRTIAALAATGSEEAHGAAARTRHCPRGVVAVITPWNNPVAIPVAKIAAALAFGNAVVWKPALAAPAVSMAVAASLADIVPTGLVSTVFGDADAARALIVHRGIAAVTLTGSQAAGAEAALLCARRAIPLQAELGGNNAAIVLADADLEAAARALAAAAFGFAGQRCTATRRIVVAKAVHERFAAMLVAAAEKLRVGDPRDPASQVGPLLSPLRRDAVAAAVARAVAVDGGRLLCGGSVPSGSGCWYPPTLVDGLTEGAALVQEETFGPVAVLQAASDFDDAMRLCNGVTQGLVASIFGRDEVLLRRFAAGAEAGILRLNPAAFPVFADAPFGGWKSSGIGPPEHGRWDREFFARPQAIYGVVP